MSDETRGGVSPSEAFAALGDETRVAILEALCESEDKRASFSDLRAHVGVRDSGQFNYHLSKLLDTFVRRTDEGEYELTYAGHRVVGAILSGTYNERGSTRTFELESRCYKCEMAIEASYEDETVDITCPSCDDQLSSFGFPPDGFEGRDTNALTQAFERWLLGVLSLIMDGICPNCYGVTEGGLSDQEDVFDEGVGVSFACRRCHERTQLPVSVYVLHFPDVIAFCADHGVDLRDTAIWNLPFVREESLTILDEEPWCVRTTIELEGETLEVTLEEDLTVSDLRRTS